MFNNVIYTSNSNKSLLIIVILCYYYNRGDNMKCVKIKDKKEFEIGEINEPVIDNENVIISILKTGICGSDIHYWVMGEPKGLVMGHEYCGIVKDAGNRKDLKVGDRVTGLPLSPCGHCEACKSGNIQYCIDTWKYATGLSLTNPGGLTKEISVRSDMVIKVPDNISDEEVAMVEPTAVGLHAVNLADIKIGETVLIIGAGIIGLVSAMFAKKSGAKVIISETNKKRGAKAKTLGVCDEWINPLEDISTYQSRFDKVIECCGNSNAVTSALTMIKPGGKIVLVGVSMEPITIPSIMGVMRENTIQGSIAYTYEEFNKCITLMSNKEIDVTKFISDVVPLEGVQKAYERLTSGEDDAVKILVDPTL